MNTFFSMILLAIAIPQITLGNTPKCESVLQLFAPRGNLIEREQLNMELQALQQAIREEKNAIIKSLLVKKRNQLMSELRHHFGDSQVDLNENVLLKKRQSEDHQSSKKNEAKILKNIVDPRFFEQKTIFEKEIDDVFWSATGSKVIISTRFSLTYIFDLANGEIHTLPGYLKFVFENQVVVKESSELAKNRVVDLDTFEELAQFEGQVMRVLNPDAPKEFLPIVNNGILQIYNLRNNKVIYEHTENVESGKPSVRIFGDRMVLDFSNHREVWDMSNKKQILLIQGWSELSTNGKWIAGKHGHQDGLIYDVRTGELLHTFDKDVTNIYFSEDLILLRIGLSGKLKWTAIDLANSNILRDDEPGSDPKVFGNARKVVFTRVSGFGTKNLVVFDLKKQTERVLNAETIGDVDLERGLVVISKKDKVSESTSLKFQVLNLNSMQFEYEFIGKTSQGIRFMPVEGIISVDNEGQGEFLYNLKSKKVLGDFQNWPQQKTVKLNPKATHITAITDERELSFFKIK